MLSRADIQLLLSLRGSFKTRKELDSDNPVHRDTLSKSLRSMEKMGFILKTPREMDGRYTAEFNLTRRGRDITSNLEKAQLDEIPETGLTDLRLRIMRYCLQGRRFGEVREELDIAEPNVDRHLKILLNTGLVEKSDDLYLTTDIGRRLIESLEEAGG